MACTRKNEPIPFDDRKFKSERNRADRRYTQKRKDIEKFNSVSEETRQLYYKIQRRNLYANMTVELNEEHVAKASTVDIRFTTREKKGVREAQEYLKSVGIEREEKATDFTAIRERRTNEVLQENIALLLSRGLDPFCTEEKKPKAKAKARVKKDRSEIKISKVINNFSEAEMELLFNVYNQKKLIKDDKSF